LELNLETNIISIVKWVFLAVGVVLFSIATQVTDRFALLILLALGFIFFAIGAGMIAYGIMSARKETDLKQNGRLIQADITGVTLNEGLQVNGRSPFQIVAQWHDKGNNKIHIFKSANLWFDPSKFVEGKATVPVYIDQNKPSRYVMDIAFLPKMA
jgi:hypothetical protein